MSHDLAKMAAERVVVIRDTDSARQAIRAAMDFMVEQGADPTVLLEELAGAALNRLVGLDRDPESRTATEAPPSPSRVPLPGPAASEASTGGRARPQLHGPGSWDQKLSDAPSAARTAAPRSSRRAAATAMAEALECDWAHRAGRLW